MKRIVMQKLLLISVVVVTLILVSGNAIGGGQEEAVPSKEAVTLQFWHRWGGERVPLMEKQISDFVADHPNISFESLVLPQDTLYQKALAAIASGEAPDVIMVYGESLFPVIVRRNGLLALDDYLKRDRINGSKIFIKEDWEAFNYNGKCYGLPLTVGACRHFLFYDKNQFKEVGLDPEKPAKTWSQLQEYAGKLTIKENGDLERMGFDVNGVQNFPFHTWLYSNNGNILSNDQKKVVFGEEEGLETIRWMVDYTDSLYGGYEPCLPFTDSVDPSGRIIRTGFYSGKVAMTCQGVWYFYMLDQNVPDKEYGVDLLPYNDRNPKAEVRIPYRPGTSYSIPSGSKHPDEAWEWVKFTCTKGCKDFFQAQFRPTCVKEYNEDPYYKENNPFWDIVLENFEKSVSSPILPLQPEIDEISHQMTEEALLHKKTPAEALKWGVEETQQLVDESWAMR